MCKTAFLFYCLLFLQVGGKKKKKGKKGGKKGKKGKNKK